MTAWIESDIFGAPWNALNKDTVKCLELLEFKKCFIGPGNINLFAGSNIKPFKVNLKMETVDKNISTLNPSFKRFLETYKANEDLYILQHHPANWHSLEEFDKIIMFLKKRGIEIVMP